MDIKLFEKRPPKRILIVKLSALGDIVQSLPVISAIKERFPNVKIDWITGEVGAGLLSEHPLIERVIVYKRKKLGELATSPLKWPELLYELIMLKGQLNDFQYDLAIDLQGLFKSGLICLLSGAKIKLGFDKTREGSYIFLNHKLPPYNPEIHAVNRYLQLLKPLGIHNPSITFPLGLNQNDFFKANSILNNLKLKPGKFICLIPGTIWPTKMWKAEYFSQVAKDIHKEFKIKSLVIGSQKDKALGEEIAFQANGAAFDLTGRTNLKSLAALFTMAKTAITVDTGPMHLAAAVGLKTIALFGPTAPWRTGPFGEGHIIIKKELNCSPCFKRRCMEKRCMLDIKVDDIIDGFRMLEGDKNESNH